MNVFNSHQSGCVAERVDGEVVLTLSPRGDSSDIRFHASVKSQQCRPMAAAGGVGGLIVFLYDECATSNCYTEY